jgi:hypothetical protein
VTDLRAWLVNRTPRPPDALPLPIAEGSGSVTDRLADAGAGVLERALEQRGERGGAFELLAADALLTYACESAAAAPDPEVELLRVLERLARRGG